MASRGKEGAAESITASALHHKDRRLPAPETTHEANMQIFVEAPAIRLIKSWGGPICFLICWFLGPLLHLFPQCPNSPKGLDFPAPALGTEGQAVPDQSKGLFGLISSSR